MLSELGKYGASFVLATQRLPKLDDPSPTLLNTLLANVRCLAALQVPGAYARKLIWELSREQLSKGYIVS